MKDTIPVGAQTVGTEQYNTYFIVALLYVHLTPRKGKENDYYKPFAASSK
jgi:hypothetical protein